MKKLFKFVMGAAAVTGVACGAVFLLKKVFGVKLGFGKTDEDDDFDDSFDDDFDDISDSDEGDREYVTLDMEKEESNEEEQKEEEQEEESVPVKEAKAE